MAEPFDIYALDVGGGKLALSPLPCRGGVAGDVEKISDWGASYVVSLTEAEEMRRLGAQALPGMLADKAIEWISYPIVDFQVPDPSQEALWADLEGLLVKALQEGAGVLVHCRGGCGRSGMAVLRLMVACGEVPGAALERLRALRPCAVETDAQMDWATKGVLRKV